MYKKDEKGKRKAEDHAANVGRYKTPPKISKVPASPAAWATAFISEVSSAAQDAIKQAALADAKGASHQSLSNNGHAASQQELSRRRTGDAEDLAGEHLVFGGLGQVWEVHSERSSLQAARYSLRREPEGGLVFTEARPPVELTSADASHVCKHRALAGACVLDSSCGLVRPFVLHQSGNAIQLSAIKFPGQQAEAVVSFQLPGQADAPLQECWISDGPTLVIQGGDQSLLVGFRGREASSGRSPSAGGAAHKLREQNDSWQVHALQLPGQCKCRSLLWARRESKHAASGCLLLGCRCGADADGHALLELKYGPETGWRAEEHAQPASVRPTAICQVPQAASAALEAGIRPAVPQLAIATSTGDLLVLEVLPGQQQPKALLRALPSILEAQQEGLEVSTGEEPSGAEQVKLLLRGSLEERMQWQTADTAQPQESVATHRLLARVRLPRAAHQLAFVPIGEGVQLVVRCTDREGTMHCLKWPLLQQGPHLTGALALAADQNGLGIFVEGQAGWLATDGVHKSAAAFLERGVAAGAAELVHGMRRPALLLPQADVVVPGKEEPEAADGMRAVLGALRRRLEGGCRAVQDAEQLAGRKAALIRTSLQLLHRHCSRTFHLGPGTPLQPTQAASGAASHAANRQRFGSVMQRDLSESVTVADGAARSALVTCEELSAAIEGGSCLVRARLRDGSGMLDLRSAKLLVSSADRPVTASMQPAQEAPQQPPLLQPWQPERSRSNSVLLCSHVDVQGLASVSSGAPLDIIAVVPLLASQSADSDAPSGTRQGILTARRGQHMQHLGSLRLDSAEMLRSQAQSVSAASPGVLAASEQKGAMRGGDAAASSTTPDKSGSETAATASRVPFVPHERRADAAEEGAQISEARQDQVQASASHSCNMPGRQPSEIRLCLGVEKASVGDVPKLLERVLGLRLEWLTSHGARLSTVDSSTVSLSFHGSRHAEATVRAADASSCHLLEHGMQSTLAAAGMTVQRSWNGRDELEALSSAVAALRVEVDACIGQVDWELSELDGMVRPEDKKLTLTDIHECRSRTDLCCSAVPSL